MKGSNKSRWAIAAGIIVVALAAAWFWHNHSSDTSAGASSPSQRPASGGRHGMRGGALAPVQAATAVNKAVPRYLSGLGTITAANTVTVRSRVDGQLMALHFGKANRLKPGTYWQKLTQASLKSPSRKRRASSRKTRPRSRTPDAIWHATSNW